MFAADAVPTGIHNLSLADRTHLLEVDQFTASRSVDAIPATVRTAFAIGVKDSTFAMANPEQDYQEGDVIVQGGLPWRRLIFSARSADHCLIHYEMGGRGHSYHVVLFKMSRREASVTWRATSTGPLSGVEALRDAIKGNRLDDFTGYSW
jgi:hypothetical protein